MSIDGSTDLQSSLGEPTIGRMDDPSQAPPLWDRTKASPSTSSAVDTASQGRSDARRRPCDSAAVAKALLFYQRTGPWSVMNRARRDAHIARARAILDADDRTDSTDR